MNFNKHFVFLSILLMTTFSCGKKGPPKSPPDSILPNYEDSYIEQNKINKDTSTQSDEENTKKKVK